MNGKWETGKELFNELIMKETIQKLKHTQIYGSEKQNKQNKEKK